MSESINIQPITNPSAVLAYAERVETRHPWDHIAGQLYALSAVNATYDELAERLSGDELAWAFVNEAKAMHTAVTNVFLGMLPITNPSAVLAYAERVETRHPWDHIAGQLFALSALAAKLDEIGERATPDVRGDQFVQALRKAHSDVTNEFLGMFGEKVA